MIDARYMKRAIHLAAGTNPQILGERVGALIVTAGEIISEGRKEFASDFYSDPFYDSTVLHAERVAIERVGMLAEGSTLYSTLEPCVALEYEENENFPPCSELIVESGIKRVVFGMLDPNPEIYGRGKDYLEMNGVEVCHLSGFEKMIHSLIDRNSQKTRKFGNMRGRDWRYPSPFHKSPEMIKLRRFKLRKIQLQLNDLMGEYPLS